MCQQSQWDFFRKWKIPPRDRILNRFEQRIDILAKFSSLLKALANYTFWTISVNMEFSIDKSRKSNFNPTLPNYK